MQCTMYVMEVRPSVRNEVSHHFFFFFFFFKKHKNDKILLKPGFELRTSQIEIWMYGRTDVLNEVILPLAKMEISM
jgi:hypothetical protein